MGMRLTHVIVFPVINLSSTCRGPKTFEKPPYHHITTCPMGMSNRYFDGLQRFLFGFIIIIMADHKNAMPSHLAKCSQVSIGSVLLYNRSDGSIQSLPGCARYYVSKRSSRSSSAGIRLNLHTSLNCSSALCAQLR